ncbi:MAG TPA: 3-phosphoglycerate dehydrogenase [Candidatus Scatomorpha pullistercoris]|uniref:D-3-phosphoglycerate dehydrogenase n=1 Tax=Candidatus Scatomorpha pullistercoris TaxID=2840929 RepID=A0A9D1K902_9FIRM|nr:3-phosphoglycerate dehydrogenase [Candidatus Scatomorpha pullistercoris]
MFKIRTMNTISHLGTDILVKHGCEVGTEFETPDALLIRSADLHQTEFWPELKCIGRAGAGTNNIPLDRCSESGIVVFNAPGANADATKEMVIFQLLAASRDILGSIEWVKSIADRGDEIPALVEKGKSAFAGPELCGKNLGVIGLGAIGVLVASTALKLGMTVRGYDPYMSVESAWRLSRDVIHVDYLEEIFRTSDYISLNVPYNESTHHMIDAAAIAAMRPGVRIVNESRAEIVDDDAMIEGLASGKVGKYVTDFPNAKLVGVRNCITTPHLGACTPESEEKCSVMAAQEIYDYLKNGNIKNSVNMPNAALDRMGECRLCVIHRNVPHMINSILDLISARNINIEHMINKPRGEYAYTMIDLAERVNGEITGQIQQNPDVLRVRVV